MSAVELPIDDDYKVYRQSRFARIFGWVEVLIGVAFASWGLVELVGSNLVGVIPIFGAVFFLWDGWSALRATGSARRRPTSAGVVTLSDTGLRLHHPILEEEIDVPFSSIRSFDIAEPVMHLSGMGHRRYELFPIRRSPGSRHPLTEPMFFLSTEAYKLGKRSVPLLSLDCGYRVPNVAILFDEPIRVRAFAPTGTSEHGWVPPDAPKGGRQTAATLALDTQRALRDLTPPGLYIRILEPGPLETALRTRGIRRGFECEDWVHATGNDHPALEAGATE